jgi:hypothetical protein
MMNLPSARHLSSRAQDERKRSFCARSRPAPLSRLIEELQVRRLLALKGRHQEAIQLTH